MNQASTGADILVRKLRDHGVRHIFGYPGGQLTPIYDAIHREPAVRHVLARDEQAAAFMADGYARATGHPGVCLAVCGPGVFNAFTPLATAYTDSIPLLLISGQVPSAGKGLRSGYYHENDQYHASATVTKWRARVEETVELSRSIDQAFTAMLSRRPGPALLEAPLDVLRAETQPQDPRETIWHATPFLMENPEAIPGLAALLGKWQRPLILAGGGVIAARAEDKLVRLAERLGAPVVTTLMGKCAIPSEHTLAAGLTWHRATADVSNMDDLFSPLFQECDGVLAIGCRFSQASTGSWKLPIPELAQIDIDKDEIGRHYPAKMGIIGHAYFVLEDLIQALPAAPRPPWAKLPVPREPWRLPGLDLVGPLRRALPRNAIVAADITRLSYILLAEFPVHERRSFLHPAGFVSMGYGIPAALGAQVAFPDRVVVAVAGDGCFLMSGMELATAVQEKLPIVVVLVNDNCLSLIKSTQERKFDKRFIAVDLQNPDFCKFAESFGVKAWRVTTDEAFEKALGEAIELRKPGLIEVQL